MCICVYVGMACQSICTSVYQVIVDITISRLRASAHEWAVRVFVFCVFSVLCSCLCHHVRVLQSLSSCALCCSVFCSVFCVPCAFAFVFVHIRVPFMSTFAFVSSSAFVFVCVRVHIRVRSHLRSRSHSRSHAFTFPFTFQSWLWMRLRLCSLFVISPIENRSHSCPKRLRGQFIHPPPQKKNSKK